jgi:hypothetical protein
VPLLSLEARELESILALNLEISLALELGNVMALKLDIILVLDLFGLLSGRTGSQATVAC